MAQSIATPAVRIKRRFAELLPEHVILDACVAAGHRWRRRRFDPVVTIHLFILQGIQWGREFDAGRRLRYACFRVSENVKKTPDPPLILLTNFGIPTA